MLHRRGYWNKLHELTWKQRSQTDVASRPRLLDFALSLDEDVIVYSSQKDFESLPNVSKSISELSALKGWRRMLTKSYNH
nr:DNA-binding protein [Tanacetum cinerariifolium]